MKWLVRDRAAAKPAPGGGRGVLSPLSLTPSGPPQEGHSFYYNASPEFLRSELCRLHPLLDERGLIAMDWVVIA